MLVCGCGKNQRRLPSREFLFPRGREHARRMFVMSAVQYQRGRLKAFEPSGPLYPGQGSGGCGRGGKGMEPSHGFQRQGCVFPLMGSGQAWAGRVPVRPGNREGRTAVPRRSFDDGHDTRVLHGSYGRFSGGDDGRFFRSDLFQGISQILLVVQTDGGQYGDILGHGVSGVQPSAQPCFQNDEVHAVFPEVAQGDGQSQLEKGGRLFPAFRQLFQEGNFFCQGIRSDHVSIDADAFRKIYQMGGSEQARDITLRPGQGLNHGAGGAFPIGAGHMDHGGVDTVRPGCRQQFFCVVKPQLDPEKLGGKEPVKGGGYVHGRYFTTGKLPFNSGMAWGL